MTLTAPNPLGKCPKTGRNTGKELRKCHLNKLCKFYTVWHSI